jgi:hypothetical protein
MYIGLKHAHSGLRWVVIALLLAAIIQFYRKWKGGGAYAEGDRKLALYALIATHAQLVLGLILYFISPYVNFASGVMKDKILRFYTIEHFVGMILAIVLITIGYSRAKRQNEAGAKFRTHYVYYLLGLIIILLSIPWPFRDLGAGWF